MKPFLDTFKLHVHHWIGTAIIVISLLMSSCDQKQGQSKETTNVGTSQDETEVDTTASSSFGGTEESTGRADTDTSGTGKASATPK